MMQETNMKERSIPAQLTKSFAFKNNEIGEYTLP